MRLLTKRGLIPPWLVMAALLGACQKSMTVNGQDVATGKSLLPNTTYTISGGTPGGAPVVVPDGLGSNRSYYQSRSTIVLNLGSDLIQVGDTFSLVDKQSGGVLIDHQTVGASLAFSAGAAALALDNDYQLTLALFPEADGLLGKLVYGGNDLNLNVESGNERQSSQHINLVDFPIQAEQFTYFAKNVQLSGGLQGGISAYQADVVSNGSNLLTTGFIPLITH